MEQKLENRKDKGKADKSRKKKRRAGRQMPLLTVIMAVSMLCGGLAAGVQESHAAEAGRPGMSYPVISQKKPLRKQRGEEQVEARRELLPESWWETWQELLPESWGETWQELPAGLSDELQPLEFTQVGQEYFDDALFIGDSRVVGVQLYAGWDNMTYYAEKGMTVYNMFERKVSAEDGREISVYEALQERSFGKIYLEIGINEMGTGTVDTFMDAYEDAVACLRRLQPDATIFLCGIMYVRQDRSESDPVFNNQGIRERNRRIAQLADNNSIFYLDINEDVADETGNLNPDYTWDAVHLLGKYDSLWLDFFCRHGIIKEPQGL